LLFLSFSQCPCLNEISQVTVQNCRFIRSGNTTRMIHHPVVGFVVCTHSLRVCSVSGSVHMKVLYYSGTAYCQGILFVLFSAATIGAVSSYTSVTVYYSATILMLVTVLATFTCATEPTYIEILI
jgi:hypothetical protein